jgi:hypothetical protein
MYDLTVRLAQLRPLSAPELYVLASIAERQTEADRLLSVFAGIVTLAEYRSLRNLAHLLGIRATANLVAARPCPTGR